MKNSHIEWCDHTFNPWMGCAKVSRGCANCYAAVSTPVRVLNAQGRTLWGKGARRERTSAANWKQPLKWNKSAGIAGTRPRVFCASLADWLDDEVPIEWLADLLELIRCTPNLDWQLLTKRPENWRRRIQAVVELGCPAGGVPSWWYLAQCWSCGVEPSNVWIGTTVEDQQRADERIPLLLAIPTKVRFLSCEPLLGPVDIHAGVNRPDGYRGYFDWVICGGESGPGARPFVVEWAWDLMLQCRKAGVPFFMKQLGAKPITGNANALDWPEETVFAADLDQEWVCGASVKLKSTKGAALAEFPEELRVREFPSDHC